MVTESNFGIDEQKDKKSAFAVLVDARRSIISSLAQSLGLENGNNTTRIREALSLKLRTQVDALIVEMDTVVEQAEKGVFYRDPEIFHGKWNQKLGQIIKNNNEIH